MRLKKHCSGMETSYLSFPRKSEAARSMGANAASVNIYKVGGGSGSVLKPGGAVSDCQPRRLKPFANQQREFLEILVLADPTPAYKTSSVFLFRPAFSPQRTPPEKGLLATRNTSDTTESCKSPEAKESSCHWLMRMVLQYRFQPGEGSRGL